MINHEQEFANKKHLALEKALKINKISSKLKHSDDGIAFVAYKPINDHILVGNKDTGKMYFTEYDADDAAIVERIKTQKEEDTGKSPVTYRKELGSKNIHKMFPNYEFVWYGLDQFYGVKPGKIVELGGNSIKPIYLHGVHNWGDDYWDKTDVTRSYLGTKDTLSVNTGRKNTRLNKYDIENTEKIINALKNRNNLHVCNAFDSNKMIFPVKYEILEDSIESIESIEYNELYGNSRCLFLWKEIGSKRKLVTEYVRTNKSKYKVNMATNGTIYYDKNHIEELEETDDLIYPGVLTRHQTIYSCVADIVKNESYQIKDSTHIRYGSTANYIEITPESGNKIYLSLMEEQSFGSYAKEAILSSTVITEWNTKNRTYMHTTSKVPVFELND